MTTTNDEKPGPRRRSRRPRTEKVAAEQLGLGVLATSHEEREHPLPSPVSNPVTEPEHAGILEMLPGIAGGVLPRAHAPEPERSRPTARRAVFFDIENASSPEDAARLLDRLEIDRTKYVIELIAVGNWRVIGSTTARLLASRGFRLIHSAPRGGVRDWSDLRIAVSAGAWLAAARPGDLLEIISDDLAFEAVGDLAASLGIEFHQHTSGRARQRSAVSPTTDGQSGRPRAGGRGRAEAEPAPGLAKPVASPQPTRTEPLAAPHDEILSSVREMLVASPGGVMLDAVANALKARGFERPAGSPRLVTRLRRFKELEVTPRGLVMPARGGGGDRRGETSAEPAGGTAEQAASKLKMRASGPPPRSEKKAPEPAKEQ